MLHNNYEYTNVPIFVIYLSYIMFMSSLVVQGPKLTLLHSLWVVLGQSINFRSCIHREFRKEFSSTLMQDGGENVNMFN